MSLVLILPTLKSPLTLFNNTSSDTIQVTTEDGNVTYDVSDDITVKRYKKTSSYLGIVSVGDTVSMKVENNEVILINIHE